MKPSIQKTLAAAGVILLLIFSFVMRLLAENT